MILGLEPLAKMFAKEILKGNWEPERVPKSISSSVEAKMAEQLETTVPKMYAIGLDKELWAEEYVPRDILEDVETELGNLQK